MARDQNLNLPKKLECIPGLDSGIKAMALSYNALRNALEHHHDLPKRDLTVTVRRIVPIVAIRKSVSSLSWCKQGGCSVSERWT